MTSASTTATTRTRKNPSIQSVGYPCSERSDALPFSIVPEKPSSITKLRPTKSSRGSTARKTRDIALRTTSPIVRTKLLPFPTAIAAPEVLHLLAPFLARSLTHAFRLISLLYFPPCETIEPTNYARLWEPPGDEDRPRTWWGIQENPKNSTGSFRPPRAMETAGHQ